MIADDRDYVADALHLAELGWRLFACDPARKRPMYRGWQTDASTDPELLAQTFRGGPERVAVGVVTGETFDVFDIEVEHLDRARAAIAATGIPLARGPISRTGGGGVHIFVRASGLRNRDLFVDDVHVGETRGIGGLVIVPPSRSAKGPYTWTRPPWAADLPDPHPALLAMLRPEPRRRDVEILPPVRAVGSMRGLARFVASLPEKNRNKGLYWAALTALEDGIPADVVESALTRAAAVTGLDEREIERTIQSAIAHA